MQANVALTSYAMRRCLAGWEVISAVKQKQQISHYCCTEFHRQVTKWKYQRALSYRYQILPGACAYIRTAGLKWDCRDTAPFCQPQTCTYHEVSSGDRTAQIQRLFYRVWSSHAADASSVFGQSIFGKPCFWQSIVWQTEWTENWKVMLLDIIRKIWSLPSYVNKSPINNMRGFLRREIQLMMTRGMRVTTNNCKAMDAPWIWAKGAGDNHSLGKHSDIWMHTSTFSEDIICLMTVILSQSSLLTHLAYDTWILLLSALLTLVRLLHITLFHSCQL